MNNIQKMENKAYKAYIKELESSAWRADNNYYKWALSNNGRRHILRGIRKIAKTRVCVLGSSCDIYSALSSQRNYSKHIIQVAY